jgi:IS1 family transposase/DNA-directed RNA polymerase subunit RPC12/RpoP
MIQETITYTCRSCGSANIIKNGTNRCGNPQYHCKDCGVYRVLKPKQRHPAVKCQQVLRAAQERVSLRGLERVFGVCRQTIAVWIRQAVWQLPVVVDTLMDYEVGDVLEADEMWSFVLNKAQKRWLWLALCRRTRQIIAFYIGQRDAAAAQQLWQRVPYPYTLCPIYTDQYAPYADALPTEQHWAKAKSSGATAHIERWNNTLRQRLARFVRKTLSFSKSDVMHHVMLEWFIIDYNQQIASLTT